MIIKNEAGEDEIVERKGIPDVEKLKTHIILIASKEGKNLKAISNFVDKFEKGKKKHTKIFNNLNNEAEELIFDFAVGTAVGVALNPIPAGDVAGGTAACIELIRRLAKKYGADITTSEIKKLANELWSEGKLYFVKQLSLAIILAQLKKLTILFFQFSQF